MLFDQGFDGRRQLKNGIGQRLVAHGFIGESLTLVACAGGVSGGDQEATKIPVVLRNGEGNRLRRVVGLEAIASKQAGLDIIELVVVFSPVGRAVQPVAAMAFKIADAGEFKVFEVIRLVQRVLEIGASDLPPTPAIVNQAFVRKYLAKVYSANPCDGKPVGQQFACVRDSLGNGAD